ncbi:MAG: response regulator transcription factor [Terriglobus sp.]
MIRVGVVEDQTLVREGLERLLLLTPDIRVVMRGSDGREGMQLLTDSSLDVLLLDLRMPEADGMDVLREAQRTGAKIPCIILTTFDDDEDILECIRLGARGVLKKDVSLETLSSAIREVHAGGTLHRPALTQRMVERLHAKSTGSPKSASHVEKLTERELQILRLMFAGLSNGEIGYALHVSEGTVKNHVSSILAKLGARDRIRAVLRAVEEGYV